MELGWLGKNGDRVRRLLHQLGLQVHYPRKRTTFRKKEQRTYPHLRGGMEMVGNEESPCYHISRKESVGKESLSVGVDLIKMEVMPAHRLLEWGNGTGRKEEPSLEHLKKEKTSKRDRQNPHDPDRYLLEAGSRLYKASA
jgi:hypothetical protein